MHGCSLKILKISLKNFLGHKGVIYILQADNMLSVSMCALPKGKPTHMKI